MIRALAAQMIALTAVVLLSNHAFALGYKEAKAECLKEKPELKGKDLRTCAKEKETAAKTGTAAAHGSKGATDAADTDSHSN